MKRTASSGLIALLALVVTAAAVSAQGRGPKGPFANVIANAECTVDGTDVFVSALLEQKPKPGSGTYDVSTVTFLLEQKVHGNPKFQEVIGSRFIELVNDSFAEVDASEQVEVATHLYENVCSLPVDPAANAVRAVVEIEVLNANPDRSGSLIHTGRCISFPNPCRP